VRGESLGSIGNDKEEDKQKSAHLARLAALRALYGEPPA
jgi:hypothetical protein